MKDNIYSAGPKIIRTYDSPFTNTDAIIIQYDDIIRARDLNMTLVLRESEEFCKLFDVSHIKNMNIEELVDWYRDREYKECVSNLNLYEEIDNSASFKKEFTIKEYDQIPLLDISKLKFYDDLKKIIQLERSITGNIYVFTDDYSKLVEDDLKIFGQRVIYTYGDFKDIITKYNITNNSTFVFSDERYLYMLNECNKINYSSILISGNYSYNEYKFFDDFEHQPVKIFMFDSLLPIDLIVDEEE